MDRPVISILGLLVGVLSLGAAIYFYWQREREQAKGLDATLLSTTNLINDVGNVRSNLKVFYKGAEVPNVSTFNIQFRNSGEQPIKKDDFEAPIDIDPENVKQIISANIVKADPADLPIQATNGQLEVSLTKALLNPGDQFTVEIAAVPVEAKQIIVQKRDIHSRIAGIKSIHFEASVTAPPPATIERTVLIAQGITAAFAILMSLPMVRRNILSLR